MMRHVFLASSLAALLLVGLPADAQRAGADIAQANEAALRKPAEASLVGALHEFAYERGAIYAVETSPQRITDIALEPGEALLSVSAGDTTRWIVGDAQSGAGATLRSHILIKPNAPGLATNLVAMTDRRVYHVDLRSRAGPAMAAVAWRYPANLKLAAQAPQPEPQAPTQFTPADLNLRYRIEGDRPDWRPLAAFDDGQQVYIEMPERIHTMEAPPLFVIGDEGPELVNYRMDGRFYVVDRLFRKAEMRLGSGWKKRSVRIIRQTPIDGEVHE